MNTKLTVLSGDQDDRPLRRGSDSQICVVGAGVIGLTVAIRLQALGYQVRIVSSTDPSDTTSAAAAAFWLPVLVGPDPRVSQLAAVTLRQLSELAKVTGTGVHPIRLKIGYARISAEKADLSWRSAVPSRSLLEAELPHDCSFGFHAEVFRVEMEQYLRFLLQRFKWRGGEFEIRRIASLAEIQDAPIIVNCSGVYSHDLVPDHSVEPIRGQVVCVELPSGWSTHGERPWDVTIVEGYWPSGHERLDYVVARSGDMLCGGTADIGNWSTAPQIDQTRLIIERCSLLLPAIRGARILRTKVGLRPFRPQLRLDYELPSTTSPVVIHAYGHGGSGVTLSWGCADEVARMVCAIEKLRQPQFITIKQRTPRAA